jgi:hypothetical protein
MIEKIPHDHPGQNSRACNGCGGFKGPEEFPLYRHKGCYGGYQAHNKCLACEKDRKLRSHLKKSYDLELEDYDQMVLDQDGRCFLCDQEPSDVYNKLVVDHCHKTGKVRKLLCRGCNVFLAKIESCPSYLNKVNLYLKGDISEG